MKPSAKSERSSSLGRGFSAVDSNVVGLRPSVIDICLDALRANLAAVREFVPHRRVMAVVKANAYGHGLVPCALELAAANVDAFGVAFLEEGVALREAGIRTPILVLGGVESNRIAHYVRYDLELTASSVSKLEAINDAAGQLKKRAKVQLKIDTGMSRIGVSFRTAPTLLERSLTCRHLEVTGIYSHFATGEEPKSSYAKLQLERFLEVLHFYEARSLSRPMAHIANSGGMLELPESHLDMVRVGLLIYGIPPAPHLRGAIVTEPVLSLRSAVVYFKVVPAGTSVSYGRHWETETETRIVTVPIGYGDGFTRALSNRAPVLIHGKRYTQRGSICMDQMMVDIGPDGVAYNGDEVMLIGKQGGEEITVGELAALANTVPHEIVTLLSTRLPRRYSRFGEVIGITSVGFTGRL